MTKARTWRDRIFDMGLRHPRTLSVASLIFLTASLATLAGVVSSDLRALSGKPPPHEQFDGATEPASRLPLPGLRRTFTEDFAALRLSSDGGPWRTRYANQGLAAYTLPTNGEKQIYVDPRFAGTGKTPLGLNPFAVKDGVLTITARPVDDAIARQMWGYRYASGLLHTKGTFAQKYGYFEVRARLSDTPSMWPAAWLLPEDGSWPPEIDIFEQLGRDPSTIYMSTVSRPAPSIKPAYTHARGRVEDAADAFHRYGLLWTESSIAFFIDDRELSRTPTPRDMHRPMYLLVNLAVGGPWAHDPSPDRPVTGTMSIDYIHAYALPASSSIGAIADGP